MKNDTLKYKLQFINYAYAIGAILVVLGHSTPTGASDMPFWIDAIRTFIYNFHMPLFFFIAGFLFRYTSEIRKKKYSVFIKGKCIKFLTPYIVLSLVGFIPKILLSDFVNDKVALNFEYIVRSFFSPRDNVWGHFWFLPTLLIIYVFSYLILKISINIVGRMFLLLFVISLAVYPIDIDWFAINDICNQLIFFCIGIFTEKLINEKKQCFFRCSFAILNVVIAISIFIILRHFDYFYFIGLMNFSNVIIGVLMIYSVLYISIKLAYMGNKILDYFEGKTFSIYIISWPCQAIAEIVANRILHMHWYIVMPIMFVVGLGVPLLISEIYRRVKWHPKFINLLFGFSFKKV